MAEAVSLYKGPARHHQRYPEMGTGPVPIEPYISEDHYRLELEHVFKRVWLYACRVEQISQPGDFIIVDLPPCQTSVILVRDQQGTIRAFHNMCSHRGNKISYDASGNTDAFTCGFHGWLYGLDGELQFVPDEHNYFDLDKGCLGLSPVHVDDWEGFVFLNVDPQPKETLQQYLGELGAGLHGYPFEELSGKVHRFETVVNANWKLVKDAFQETCHTPYQHRRSLPDAYRNSDNPHTRLIDMGVLGHHGRASLFGNMAHVPSPVASHAYAHGATIVSAALSDEESKETSAPGVNPTNSPDWSFELNVFFPAFFIAVARGSYFAHQFLPLSVDKTLWQSAICYPEPDNMAEQFSQEYSRVMFRDIMVEDGRQIEETQSMLRSGAKQHFILKDEELLIRHTLFEVDRMIQEGLAAS
ncbi:MAG: 3-phenylpropionate dioxygenase [Gammaproteobacteria bacterium]|nr:3-phenylpropionate dioxygenase [Gammaproteobacteria bacterium]